MTITTSAPPKSGQSASSSLTLKKDAKKVLKANMLPQEVADFILDILRSDKKLSQFTLVKNEPAQLGGKDGFRLVYTFMINKVRYRNIYYGMLQDKTFYRISYSAPVRYYFDKDVAAFEKIVGSFKLVEEKSGAAVAAK